MSSVRGISSRLAQWVSDWRARRGGFWPSSECGAAQLRLDVHGVALAASPGCCALLGIDERSLVGAPFVSRTHVADRPEFLCALDRARRGCGPVEATIRLRVEAEHGAPEDSEAPRFVWVEARIQRAGAAVFATLRDVSETRRLAERLEAAQREAAAAMLLKDRVLANVSHELRTPLNAILGFSELLGNPTLAPISAERQVEYARIIHSSAEHLLSVVNVLLDMSKLEAGQFEIEPEAFALPPLIESCRSMLTLKAAEAGVEIETAVAEGDPEIVADKRACRQILINLVSNAVKFSARGGRVVIETRGLPEAIEISVSDEGIGIAKEHLSRVGDPFFQARGGYDRSTEGAGLGLSLVRGLVGLHGGSVKIESALDVGTRVTVRLPLDCRAAPRAAPAATRFETVARLHPAPCALGATRRNNEEKRFA
ncbi:MAG: ATP-binding protein [Roseiarcus sp.]